MTNDRDRNPPLTGEHGAQTGFDTPDPKDDHQGAYTTTPAEDRVGSSDDGKYEPVEVHSAKEVTGQFDHLATRDVAAMEHKPQDAEFAGAETVAGLGGENLNLVAPAAGIGMPASAAIALESRQEAIDPNRAYTPPSEQGPARVSERPGDLPEGETPELQYQVKGDTDRGF
ncbi:hypothetical protein [Deinococcus radiotolerans]|uniref:DUF5709 domain-containing protein n=1 Tax=Deinococcus radiotolerans TaxID=1309407 RepID=A0ABQ2FGW5_9DEIO|nr:hypothetical protein [Deinococcus radiotolerans]GGK94441.1 hypothetical protein GCM10010844_11190 [Deinococcus radiotolerans]